jgi:hypothetical protein
MMRIVGNHNHSAKRKSSEKKPQSGWNTSQMQKSPALIDLRRIPVQK